LRNISVFTSGFDERTSAFVQRPQALNVLAMPQPEAYLGYADKLFDEKDKLTNDAVWNGIFDAGDWRAKRGLKTMSPRRDRKSESSSPAIPLP
jgi:hypothetical protein